VLSSSIGVIIWLSVFNWGGVIICKGITVRGGVLIQGRCYHTGGVITRGGVIIEEGVITRGGFVIEEGVILRMGCYHLAGCFHKILSTDVINKKPSPRDYQLCTIHVHTVVLDPFVTRKYR
jgi:formylmethanofuran dehydrogenase subunit C